MPPDQRTIERMQDDLLKEMKRHRVVRRGTLTRQEYAGRRERNEGAGATGPYYLWQGSVNGKRFARRVGAEEAERMEREIDERRKFEELSSEFVALGEALAESLACEGEDEAALKKKSKSPSSKAKKSRG
jgi:hypothetical protein